MKDDGLKDDRPWDGGPAFPAHLGTMAGMSLRDYFAAHAPGMRPVSTLEQNRVVDAELAYRWADAMLKAREK